MNSGWTPSGGTSARTQTHALAAAIRGTRGPRAIHLNGLTRASVFRRRRTTGAFSSPGAAIQDRKRLHLMHSGDSSTRGDEFPKDDQQDRRHGRPRHPREPGPTARTATASTSPADTDDEGPLRPGGGRRRPRAAGRRDGLRLVWRADHRASPGPDPQMVFGDLPAPRLGVNPRCGLGPGGSADRRTARASLRAAVSHPTRLASGPRRFGCAAR
jgi:hypothetical protein